MEWNSHLEYDVSLHLLVAASNALTIADLTPCDSNTWSPSDVEPENFNGNDINSLEIVEIVLLNCSQTRISSLILSSSSENM